MRYLLDTNICIYLIRNKSEKLTRKLTALPVVDVAISAITLAGLEFGVEKSSKPEQNKQALDNFLVPLTVLDFDHDAALAYGQIRARLESQGIGIGPLDTLIAAHARSRNLTLITNNTGEFERIPGLIVEDWS